ncbi:oxidoreductase [Streptomyces sp. NPDC020875]|uniref:oxidoreductase n=1 Tax=Streptomyces sp. NPDC020875 TaxID=3154898 RepID=UPI0033CCCD6F
MSKKVWTAEPIPDQTGRVAVVTGASSGLGLATANALAKNGANVVLALRNKERGERARAEIAAGLPAGDPAGRLRVRLVDLADLDSVRAFADTLRAECRQLDLLVNNAGLMAPPRTLSPQGHEIQFATNHLGHFALTGLLFDLLTGDDPRVVTITSVTHHLGRIHWDDLDGARSYSPTRYYYQSKLANAIFGTELHRRATAAASPVTSVLAHPGYAATALFQADQTGPMKVIGRLGDLARLGQPVARGVLPQLCAATGPDVRGGDYLGPDGPFEIRGAGVRRARPAKAVTDPENGRRLWELSERLTGVAFTIPNAAGA